MSKRVIILDVDGTLVDYDLKLSGSTLVAIDRARKAGHEVYLCTGRSKAETFSALYGLPVDGYIGGKGAYIEVRDVPIYHHPHRGRVRRRRRLAAAAPTAVLPRDQRGPVRQPALPRRPRGGRGPLHRRHRHHHGRPQGVPALRPSDGRPRAGVNKISWVIQSPRSAPRPPPRCPPSSTAGGVAASTTSSAARSARPASRRPPASASCSPISVSPGRTPSASVIRRARSRCCRPAARPSRWATRALT